MRRLAVFFAFLIGVSVVGGVARAEMVQYMSRHPLPKRVGHGFCDIDVPHFHDYPPSDPRLYREVNGQYYFVGDPTPFGYDGPRYSFYGPHPIADVNVQFGGPTYCYLRGPHYHWYAPPPSAHFEMRGGAYWYVGSFEPVFYVDQPRFVVVNDVYAPLVYTRPVIDVSLAPPAFHGEIVVGGPGWRGGPMVGGPGWHEGPGWHGGPERREMVMHERHEELRREEHWDRGHGPGWHGGPEHGGPWRGPERGPERGPGWHGGQPAGAGWHAAGGPSPGAGPHGGQPGGFHSGGGPAPHGGGAPHGNGFHR
ncbi:MAG TPA: hypothetical protein VMT03_25465 [Polyangia bacterium]|nr:hypothetical protein [Polyangia bacterium]